MMKKVIRIKTAIIVWIAVFVLSIGATFALVSWNSRNTSLAGSTLCYDIIYEKGQDINFGSIDENGLVIDGMTASLSFDESKSAVTTVTLERRPSCELYGLGTITANINVTPSNVSISTGALKYKIINNTTTEEVSNGSITKTGATIIYDNFIINETTTYTIYFWLDANYIDNTYLEATFSGTIESSAISTTSIGELSEEYLDKVGPGTLYYQLSSNAYLDSISSPYVTSSTGINFASNSSNTNGKGVYLFSETKSDRYPVYYYRGAVDNNNIIFADFCWKIVRTTSTGGIKLIYNGTPTNGTCNNTGEDSQIGASSFNSTQYSLAYIGYMYGTTYTYKIKIMSNISDEYYYGNDVTYSNGQYTLIDTISSSDWSSIYNGGLNNNHYTCFSTETICNSVYYIYYTTDTQAYYMTLEEGKKIEDIITEMLDKNTTSSTIKGNKDTEGTIDYWYYKNIEQEGYSGYIEDTIWCNDRSIENLNGWNPNGGTTTININFNVNSRTNNGTPSLECFNNEDKFTKEEINGNGKLDYPVGLITSDEAMISGASKSGGNSSYYLYNAQIFWTNSPNYFGQYNAINSVIYSGGSLNSIGVYLEAGVRPSISLKIGTKISSGDGTVNNPYIINLN